MKTAFFLFSGLLAVARAAEYVTDGSFEDVPPSRQFTYDFTDGGWTFAGRATIYQSFVGEKPKYGTPDGRTFPIVFNSSPGQTSGSFSQPVSGLTTGETYTLSYIFRPETRSTVTCRFIASLGSQTIDTLVFRPSDSPDVNYIWRTRTTSFAPESSDGTLKFELLCSGKAQRGRHWDFDFDGISITGP